MRTLVKLLIAAACVGLGASGAASAQELTHQFTSPTFGGNPFNSDHLLAVASAQRPEKKEDPEKTLSEGDQFAQQIKSRLLSALSSSLVEAITGSTPGTTGEFIVGDQTISFDRGLSQVTVKITDNATGQVTTVVVPVLNFNNPATTSSAALSQSVIPTGPLSGPVTQ